MNLAWRDIRHQLGRFVLTCLGLSLLLAVVITMAGIYRGQTADGREDLRQVPAVEPLFIAGGRLRPAVGAGTRTVLTAVGRPAVVPVSI